MTSLELLAWLRDTHERGASSLGCEQVAAEIERMIARHSHDVHSCHANCARPGCVNARMRAAVLRTVENIEHWLDTGSAAGADQSRAIYEQLCAAICREPVDLSGPAAANRNLEDEKNEH